MPRDLLAPQQTTGPRDLLASAPKPNVEGFAETMEREQPDPGPEAPVTPGGLAKAAGSGLATGLASLAGLPSDIGVLWNAAGDKLTDAVFGDDPKMKAALEAGRSRSAMRDLPGGADVKEGVESVTGDFYKPQNTSEEFASTIGEFAPAMLAGPGGLVRRGATQVLAPAVGSEAAGQMTEGTEAEPYARMIGALGGAFAPGVAARAVTPFPIAPERAAMVKTLADEGVPLTAGQKTGNRGLQYAESILGDVPFGSPKAKQMADAQGDAFSAAMMRRTGENAPATPEVVKRASERIGKGFDDISSRNTLTADAGLAQDMTATIREYARVLPANQKEVFGNMAGDIVDRFRGGAVMDGKDYQQIRSRLSRMAESSRQTDPEFANSMRGLRDALDNSFARQVQPGDADALKLLRKQYGNLKTVQKAVTGGGESAAFGRVSPAQLRQSVATGNNRGAYAKGEGDFADLARAGQGVMTPLPNSGTAQRSFIQSLVGGGAGAMAAVDGGATAAMTLAAPAVASRTLHSRPVQAYLSNQALAALDKVPPARRAAVAAFLASLEARSSAGGQVQAPAQ